MNQILKIIFILSLLGITRNKNVLPTEPEVASHIAVTHYICDPTKDLGNAKVYSVGEVETCKLAPEDVEISYVRATLYQKTYLRNVEAIRCTMEHSTLTFWCGQYSHSSIHREKPTIASTEYLTPEECKHAYEKGYVKMTLDTRKKQIKFENGTEVISVHTTGQHSEDDTNIDCDEYGYVHKHSFKTTMNKMNLTYNIKSGKIQNYQGLELPCKFDEGGCQTSNLDKGAYTWDVEKSCIFVRVNHL